MITAIKRSVITIPLTPSQRTQDRRMSSMFTKSTVRLSSTMAKTIGRGLSNFKSRKFKKIKLPKYWSTSSRRAEKMNLLYRIRIGRSKGYHLGKSRNL